MTRKNTPDAKNRILQAAVKVFAAKSFEGSRIDEVAEEANVPKSLIYYHFKNKEEILEVLIQGFITQYTELLQITRDDTHQTKASAMTARLESHYREFAFKNADLIRVMFIDSLKKSNRHPAIFKIVAALIGTEETFQVTQGLDGYDRQERLIAEFFTSIIPLYAYLCFAEPWVDHFQVDRKEFDRLFLKIMAETHGVYHNNHA